MTNAAPERRYRSFMADSDRWTRFRFRPDDVVVTTPSKCGTTWMQTIVAMLLLGRTDLGAPISTISPWIDMLIEPEDEMFASLERQTHRRSMKTHTPLDGVPMLPTVTYIAVVRHPLDVALSDRDHGANMRWEHTVALRESVSGRVDPDVVLPEEGPEDPSAYLRWFIDNDNQPSASGPYGLADFCHQVRTYWDARAHRNLHLFHYADLWNNLDGEMRRVADLLHVPIDEERWPAFVEAATLTSMRARAEQTAPNAHSGIWQAPERFFAVGGTRDWASLLTEGDLAHFDERLHALAGDAAAWVLRGRAALAG